MRRSSACSTLRRVAGRPTACRGRSGSAAASPRWWCWTMPGGSPSLATRNCWPPCCAATAWKSGAPRAWPQHRGVAHARATPRRARRKLSAYRAAGLPYTPAERGFPQPRGTRPGPGHDARGAGAAAAASVGLDARTHQPGARRPGGGASGAGDCRRNRRATAAAAGRRGRSAGRGNHRAGTPCTRRRRCAGGGVPRGRDSRRRTLAHPGMGPMPPWI